MYSNLSSFKASKIFLSFSWKDKKCAEKIYDVLKSNFFVYFALAGEFGDYQNEVLIGSDPIEEKKIYESDIFCFIASSNSLVENSYAFQEYTYAKNKKLPIFIIKISTLPEYFSAKIFFNLEKCILKNSIKKSLVNKVYNVLYLLGGLKKTNNYYYKSIIGGKESVHNNIIHNLVTNNNKNDFFLNFVIPKLEMDSLIAKINSLNLEDRNKLIDSLIYKYTSFHGENIFENLRQNSITIVSKLAEGENSLVKEFSKRAPDFPTDFLFRGFHIALSQLGDETIIEDYIYGLIHEQNSEWESQRNINKRFHLEYYGGLYPTLEKLRKSIKILSPKHLLPLNVYTLGELSKFKADISLLEKYYSQLNNNGVMDNIIRDAINSIHLKSKITLNKI